MPTTQVFFDPQEFALDLPLLLLVQIIRYLSFLKNLSSLRRSVWRLWSVVDFRGWENRLGGGDGIVSMVCDRICG